MASARPSPPTTRNTAEPTGNPACARRSRSSRWNRAGSPSTSDWIAGIVRMRGLHDRPAARTSPRDRLGPGRHGPLESAESGAPAGEIRVEDRDQVEPALAEVTDVVGPPDQHLVHPGEPGDIIAGRVGGRARRDPPSPLLAPAPARRDGARSRSPRTSGIVRPPRRRRSAPTPRRERSMPPHAAHAAGCPHARQTAAMP